MSSDFLVEKDKVKKMKKSKGLLGLVMLLGATSVTQAQMSTVLNNDVFVVLSDSAHLVLDNPAPNALTTMAEGGNIIIPSEAEALQWNIGTNVGTYTLPLTTSPLIYGGSQSKIPLELQVKEPAIGSGHIRFSSYQTANDNTPYASGITHMNSPGIGDVSLMAVDRFWIVEPSNYTINPEAELTLSYEDGGIEMGGSNSISEALLTAQRWNDGNSAWEGLTYGIANSASNTVSNIVIPADDFQSKWVLVQSTNPLPIELLYFDVNCSAGAHVFEWASATEIDNSHFIVQQSTDGTDWHDILIAPGAGNSSTEMTYRHEQIVSLAGEYFRLIQVDYDGTETAYEPLHKSCGTELQDNISLTVYPSPNNGQFRVRLSASLELATAALYDASGRRIVSQNFSGKSLSMSVNVAPGIYNLVVSNEKHDLRTKVIIE